MSVPIKIDQSDTISNEEKITEALKNNPKGLTDGDIMKLTNLTVKEVVDALNPLNVKGLLKLAKLPNGNLIYTLKSAETSARPKGLDAEEYAIYSVIKEAGTKGIWNKNIMEMCKVQAKQLDKLLKSLESKKLVKKITSTQSTRKRIYMLYNLVPDETVTGGVFYRNQKFNAEFVQEVTSSCLRILHQKVEESKTRDLDLMELKRFQFMSTQDILKTFTEKNITKVKLMASDIDSIMQTLIFDGKIEKDIFLDRGDGSQTSLYRATSPFIQSTALMHTPCGHCPVRDDCYPGGVICPERCIYMSSWLDF